jgi:hypothetical protein
LRRSSSSSASSTRGNSWDSLGLGFRVLADRLLELLQESGQVRRSRVRFVDE